MNEHHQPSKITIYEDYHAKPTGYLTIFSKPQNGPEQQENVGYEMGIKKVKVKSDHNRTLVLADHI